MSKKKMQKHVKRHYPKVIIVLAVIGVIELLNIALTAGARKLLQDDLTRNVYRMTDGLYRLDFGNLDIHLLSGFASLDDITFRPDSARLQQLYDVDSLPQYYGSAKIRHLDLVGVNFRGNWKTRELRFRHIDIIAPQFTVYDNADGIPVTHPKPKVSKVRNKSLYEMIAPYLDAISVGEVRLKEGEICFTAENKADTTFFRLNNIQMTIQDVRIDSLADQRSNFLYSENVLLSIDSTRICLPGNLYTISSGKIAVNLKDSTLQIHDFAYASSVSKWEFACHDPEHSDWIGLRVGNLEAKNFHFRKWQTDKSLLLDSLLVSDIFIGNYKNQKIPMPPKAVPMIYEQVQHFPLPFRVNYVRASNLNILYEELAPNGTDPGAIRFTQMEGIFPEGCTNIISSHTQTNQLIATGKLMNQGRIDAELHFPVDTAYDVVHIKGTLGTMNMIALNSIIEPLAPARIRSGFIQQLNFNITGGKEKATIDMCLLYNDLSVQILSPEENGNRSDNAFLSLLANACLTKNNPVAGKNPLHVHTEHIRDPYHLAFNYLWKIYLAGLTETLGYTKERQERVAWVQSELKKRKKKSAGD